MKVRLRRVCTFTEEESTAQRLGGVADSSPVFSCVVEPAFLAACHHNFAARLIILLPHTNKDVFPPRHLPVFPLLPAGEVTWTVVFYTDFVEKLQTRPRVCVLKVSFVLLGIPEILPDTSRAVWGGGGWEGGEERRLE